MDPIIITQEGVQRGIFFESPIQKRYLETVYFSVIDSKYLSAEEYNDKLNESKLYRMFHYILGNGKIIKNIHEWIEKDNFAGVTINVITFPIRFSRKYRRLIAIDEEKNIKISSFGYEGKFENVGGGCKKEITKIKVKGHKRIKNKETGSYKYTYEHIIKNQYF